MNNDDRYEFENENADLAQSVWPGQLGCAVR